MNGIAARAAELATPRILLALALVVGVLAMQAGRGTLAYFTSTIENTGNTFTAGTLTLSDSGVGFITATATGNTAFKPSSTTYGEVTLGLVDTDVNARVAGRIARASTTYVAPQSSAALTSSADWDTILTWTVYARNNALGTCDGNAANGVTGTNAYWTVVTLNATPFHVLATDGVTTYETFFAKSATTAITGTSDLILCFVMNWPDQGDPGAGTASNADGDNEFRGLSHTYTIEFRAEQS